MSTSTEGASEQPSAPAAKSAAAASSAYFRPILRESLPLAIAPAQAPQSSPLTMTSSWKVVVWKVSRMKGSAPEITPTSRPKSSPASAAEIAAPKTAGRRPSLPSTAACCCIADLSSLFFGFGQPNHTP